MANEPVPPLGPPPRRARLLRGLRNLRHGYRSVFALVIFVFVGWAALDAWRLYELSVGDNEAASAHPRFMLICRGLAAVVAVIVLMLIERPLRRELWLARQGLVGQGQILATGKGRRKRARPWITYAFRTTDGKTVEGKCFVPRSTPAAVLISGQTIDVLYDPANPARNKARLGMASIEFSADSPAKNGCNPTNPVS